MVIHTASRVRDDATCLFEPLPAKFDGDTAACTARLRCKCSGTMRSECVTHPKEPRPKDSLVAVQAATKAQAVSQGRRTPALLPRSTANTLPTAAAAAGMAARLPVATAVHQGAGTEVRRPAGTEARRLAATAVYQLVDTEVPQLAGTGARPWGAMVPRQLAGTPRDLELSTELRVEAMVRVRHGTATTTHRQRAGLAAMLTSRAEAAAMAHRKTVAAAFLLSRAVAGAGTRPK